MKRNFFLLLITAVALACCLIARLDAATIVYDPSTSTVQAGQSFTVAIYGESTLTMGGYSLYLYSSANGNEITINSQTLNSVDFTYGGFPPTLPQTISTSQTSSDLGAFTTTPLTANVLYLLSTETIFIDISTTPGVYTISNTAGTVFADDTFTQADYAGVTGFSFTVTAVPEPQSTMLILMGTAAVLMTLAIRRRRQAA